MEKTSKDPKRIKSSIYDTVYFKRNKSSIYDTVYFNRIKISIYDTVHFKWIKSIYSIYHTIISKGIRVVSMIQLFQKD